METQEQGIPRAFFWRRLHSLTGAWLAIFIIFHLFTNAQAALLIGDDGSGFIRAVSAIHEIPFLPVVECLFLVFPIVIHMVWGIKYLRSARFDSFGNTGHTPYLPEYPKNHAYTWQRITSWLLVFGILAHIIHMRFIEYPESTANEQGHSYMVRVTQDEGLESIATRLGVKLYTAKQIGIPLKEDEVMAVSDNFGTAELMMVRNTFKSPVMIALYTLLVVTTCFHAFNGLWTFMIKWGITLTQRSQYLMRMLSIVLMVVVGALGLSAVWLTYWINLKS